MADNCPFEVKPFAQSKISKNPELLSINYVNQDYSSLRTRMLEIIKTNYSKEFNDFNESSLAVMLVELWAYLGDQLSFKIDQIANEVFVDTVTELTNAFRLCRLLGFKPTPALPAKCMFVLSMPSIQNQDLYIETPVKISYPSAYGANEYRMELFAADANGNPVSGKDICIPAGKMTTNTVVGIEGETHEHDYEGTGEAWQVTIPTGSPVLYRSVKVHVDGQAWQEVDYFTDSNPRKEYRVEYTPEYRAMIIFGDNNTGLIPKKGSAVKISYRVGGGTAGNIVTGAVDQRIYAHIPSIGHMITLNVKNYTRGEGGYDGDTIEDIRRKLPLYLKTQDRCVTGEDYKAIADNFVTPYNGSIGKSNAVLRNHGCAGNIIDIYVLARDGYTGLLRANDNLKTEFAQELIKKKMFTDTVCIKDGDVVVVDINIDIILDRTHRRLEHAIRERVERRVWTYFALENWEFGQSLKESEIIKVLSEIPELKHIDATFMTENSIETGRGTTNLVTVKYNEIIRPDNINVNFSYKESNE